jgi:hypothetical protein
MHVFGTVFEINHDCNIIFVILSRHSLCQLCFYLANSSRVFNIRTVVITEFTSGRHQEQAVCYSLLCD